MEKSQNSRNQGFSYFFWLIMEGSRSGYIQIMMEQGMEAQNFRILWMQIRIHNTAVLTGVVVINEGTREFHVWGFFEKN